MSAASSSGIPWTITRPAQVSRRPGATSGSLTLSWGQTCASRVSQSFSAAAKPRLQGRSGQPENSAPRIRPPQGWSLRNPARTAGPGTERGGSFHLPSSIGARQDDGQRLRRTGNSPQQKRNLRRTRFRNGTLDSSDTDSESAEAAMLDGTLSPNSTIANRLRPRPTHSGKLPAGFRLPERGSRHPSVRTAIAGCRAATGSAPGQDTRSTPAQSPIGP